MSGRLWLFSSKIERDAAFADGIPPGLLTGVAGVGLIDAGIMTSGLIDRFRPDEIVYLGTCGAYPESGIRVGRIVAGGSARLGSGDTARGEMRIPQLLPSELTFNRELTHSITRRLYEETIGTATVLCTLGVTEEDGLAEILGRHGEVENLEVFSVLRAAGSIPTAAILGVTNIVGEGGGKNWLANYRGLMARLALMFALR